MKVEDLKNYGRGFIDIKPDPDKMKQMRKAMSEELRRELGLINMIKLMWRMRKETKRMKNLDWSGLMERGLADRKFLDGLIQSIAPMKALVGIIGMEKASDIYCRVWDKMAYDLVASMYPSVEEFKACGDAFECFKEYAKALNTTNERDGLHEIEIMEDTDDVFAFNVKYCVWHEVAKRFGDPYLCYPSSCYGDEVFFPEVCAQAGFRFKRTGTLATGASVCDFKFERLAGDESK